MLEKIKNKRAALALLLCCIILVCLSGCVAPPAEKAPVAQISATPTTVMIGESITFSAADSTDSDGSITSYEWDFGDGNTASGEAATHTYSDKGGIYNVKLTVTDDDGLSDTAEVSVNVLIGVTVKIEATSSTWREGGEPYDIYNTTKQKLEEAGITVVPEESDLYDATLFVDYEEKKGGEYTSGGHGTRIKCNLKLCDKTDNLLFEKEISTSTSFTVNIGLSSLYWNAVSNFESQLYFKYLGEIIATKFGVGDEVSVLITALKDEDFRVRYDASFALGEIGEPAVEPLIQALKDEDSDVRERAAVALGNIGDKRAVEPLIQALKDEDSDVRERAAVALGKIGEPAVEPLIRALKDEDSDVRYNAADALGKIGEPAVEPLIQALKDEYSDVREKAADALGKIGNERAVEPLIHALEDEYSLVRYYAALALGKIRDKRAIEPLTNALEDESSLVRNAAREALEKIQGK
jgi:phosphoribosyl-ATP pyrophosphohydrolase